MTTFDLLKDLLLKDRSIRRFDEKVYIETEDLKSIVGLVRYCASGRNLQPLKYKVVNDPELNKEIFPLCGWAGYLKDWAGPEEGERPVAYIIQCLDTSLTADPMCDEGLQLQAITLGATAMGLGGCIIKSFNKKKLIEILNLPEKYEPRYIYALGYPVEKVVIEDIVSEGDEAIKYYRTEDKVHHVPKRTLNDLLILNDLLK